MKFEVLIFVAFLVACSAFYPRSVFKTRVLSLSSDNIDDFAAPRTVPAEASINVPVAETKGSEDADEKNEEASTPPVPVAVRKEEISGDMKERLRRELESQGANPNVAAANPILLISAIVAFLVIAGGKDILY